MLELIVPKRFDSAELATVVKSLIAAASVGSSVQSDLKISDDINRVILLDGTVSLIEGNAIVRYLCSEARLNSRLFELEESDLWSFIVKGQKLTIDLSVKLSALLPAESQVAETAVLFGDLHALVVTKGTDIISEENSLVKWYRDARERPNIKRALVILTSITAQMGVDTVTKKNILTVEHAAQKNAPNVERKEPRMLLDPNVILSEQKYPVLPKENETNYLITSALPYVNNVPHLGNIIGSTLSADFFARYCKARGRNTLFICGTDEYGTATETRAIEENITPLELCTRYYHVHKAVYDWFEIEFDHFGRTSTPQQTEIAQDIVKKLHENGFLEEQEMEQLFCEKHEGYLADRYVEGICPKCGYMDARGDQCDGCGQMLDPFELIHPRCKLDGTSPIRRHTKHLFLSLDKLQPQLEDWLNPRMDHWTKGARQITKGWIDTGLHPRSITRDLKWGTPVPIDGYEDKVLYVWFDAPIGYASITANYTDQWEQWWRQPISQVKKNIKLYQFMGKDNTAFHSVMFPSTELGTGENWTTVDYLCTTDYLQYEGDKFSKSRNVGVFDVKELGVPSSVWRYYLALARPETTDTQFSWRDFMARNNNELLANLGNYVNRVVKFTISRYGGQVPDFKPAHELMEDSNRVLKAYLTVMDKTGIREGAELMMRFSARGNQFLQENKLDNKLFLENPSRCASVIGTALNHIYVLSSLIWPFMPSTARQITDQLAVPTRKIPDEMDLAIKPSHVIGQPQYLFSRMDEEKISKWRSEYQGDAAKTEK